MATATFTGKSLVLIRDALAGAISDVRMHIGSCPNVFEYAEDLDELEAECAAYQRLLNRVERKLQGDAS